MTLGTRVEGVYSERYVSSRGEVGAFPVEGKRDDKKACDRKGVTDRNRLITDEPMAGSSIDVHQWHAIKQGFKAKMFPVTFKAGQRGMNPAISYMVLLPVGPSTIPAILESNLATHEGM